MYAYHKKKKGMVTLAVTQRKTSRNFLFNDDHLLVGWENNKTGEQRISRQSLITYPGAFTCVHIIEPKMLGLIKQEGKFSIIDTYLDLAKTNDIYVYDHTGDVVVDVGKPESIQKAEQFFT
jgi:NDP-sugar pyrophosphorylase family protein